MRSSFRQIFNFDYYRNTQGGNYHFYKYFRMPNRIKIIFWMRKCQHSKGFFNWINRLFFRIVAGKHNNDMSWRAHYGAGIFLGHSGGRYINEHAIIGDNCNLNHNITIGQENRGKRCGTPTLGNNVWVGANAVIVGKINIGNNVLIAPNAFVNFDVPDNSIVIGNPAKIVFSEHATKDYINWVK